MDNTMKILGISLAVLMSTACSAGDEPPLAQNEDPAPDAVPEGMVAAERVSVVTSGEHELSFVEAGEGLVTIETFPSDEMPLSAELLVEKSLTPLEAYITLTGNDESNAPARLIEDHYRRTDAVAAPVEVPEVRAGLRPLAPIGGTGQGCSTEQNQFFGSLFLFNPTAQKTISPPNPFGNSTQWATTRAAPQSYFYMACSQVTIANHSFQLKPHSQSVWSFVPIQTLPNVSVLVLHTDDAVDNFDIIGFTGPTNAVHMHGRVAN